MDIREPATKGTRKRGNKKNANSAQKHTMKTRSKTQNAVNNSQDQETDPLKMGHILENIFSYLDAESIKAARQVDPLWSIEGAKMLITKHFVKIPSELQAGGLSTKAIIMDKFKHLLSLKSKNFPVVPNIIVGAVGDVEWWKSLRVLGQQVKSLKLKIFDNEAELLQHLFDLLPNLKYLKLEDINLHTNRNAIMKVIISTMTKREKEGSSFTISSIVLAPCYEKELTDIEKLSECKNVKIEELTLYWYDAMISSKVRLTNAISNILLAMQNVLKRLTVHNGQLFLSLLEFPCVNALNYINLKFWPHTVAEFPGCKFSPSFRFSEKLPNLQEITMEIKVEVLTDTDWLKNLLENAGTASSVKRVICSGKCMDCAVDTLFKTFPNTEDLEVHVNSSSVSKFRTLWTHGKNLKKLALHVDVIPFMWSVIDLDFLFTGFDALTVEKIKETTNLNPYRRAELRELRVNPSISNLKGLEQLAIYFSDVRVITIPKRMFTVVAKYEIKLLPKLPKVFIKFNNTRGFKGAFHEVSQLPNFKVQFKDEMYLTDSDSDSDCMYAYDSNSD